MSEPNKSDKQNDENLLDLHLSNDSIDNLKFSHTEIEENILVNLLDGSQSSVQEDNADLEGLDANTRTEGSFIGILFNTKQKEDNLMLNVLDENYGGEIENNVLVNLVDIHQNTEKERYLNANKNIENEDNSILNLIDENISGENNVNLIVNFLESNKSTVKENNLSVSLLDSNSEEIEDNLTVNLLDINQNTEKEDNVTADLLHRNENTEEGNSVLNVLHENGSKEKYVFSVWNWLYENNRTDQEDITNWKLPNTNFNTETEDTSNLNFPVEDNSTEKEDTDILLNKNSCIYEGMCDRKKNKFGIGKLYNENRQQYVEGEWQNDYLVSIHFAQFRMKNFQYYRLNGVDNLITCQENNFVGRIFKKPLKIKCDDFRYIQREIISRITITKILDDDLQITLFEARKKFKLVLDARAKETCDDRTALQDMFYIRKIQNNIPVATIHDMNVYLLNKIVADANISTGLKFEANTILQNELLYLQRNEQLPSMKLSNPIFSWRIILRKYINNGIGCVKKTLNSIAPTMEFISSATTDIRNLTYHQVLNISVDDVNLFSDLEITVEQYAYPSNSMKTSIYKFFSEYVTDLWNLVMKKSNNNREEIEISATHSLTKPVYLQLFKTLLELLVETLKMNTFKLSDIIIKDSNGNLNLINQKNISEDSAILISRMEFVIKLLRHFKPGDLRNKRFEYTFSFFVEKRQSFLKDIFNNIIKVWNFPESKISEDYLIWLYYIHNNFMIMYDKKKMSKNNNVKELHEFLNFLLNTFKQVIETSNPTFEKLRILSKSVMQFAILMNPYFINRSLNGELLMEQCNYISDLNDDSVNSVTNIIDTYQNYWEQRSYLVNFFLEMFDVEPLETETKLIISNIDSLAHSTLTLKIQCDKFIVLLRALNEFIIFLLRTQCPWFVKRNDIATEEYVIRINSNKESYEVIDFENYIKECIASNISIPEHYIFEVTKNMITCTETFLLNNEWPMNEKMQATSDLLLAMGRSMVNFKEQACYEDFDNFLNACTKPFMKVTETSNDIEEFSRRIARLENYYAYTKEITDISIKKVLNMCQKKCSILSSNKLNYTFNMGCLNSCYNIYSEQFKLYIDKHVYDEKFGTEEIVSDIRDNLKMKDVKTWSIIYKRNYIPKLLAGLSAVWSILESEDVIDQQKIFKPHCIQILCILRLLGADQKRNSFQNHLAQVLTGQGKSIVLALLASVLALTGNSVRVVCYNKYLATRDETLFTSYFQIFDIEEDITYGTFNNMANEILSLKLNNKKYNLRTCVGDLITDSLQATKQYVRTKSNPLHTVLLIDEVDVFFSPQFYGKTYDCATLIFSKSIAKIQTRIWDLVFQESDKYIIKTLIQEYAINILKNDCEDIFIKIFSKSKTLLDQHIEEMIFNAIEVKNGVAEDWYIKPYKLNEFDCIIYIKADGMHCTSLYCKYYNVFNYFKLKKHDFDNYHFKNFGYLNISAGSVSYAMLPNEHAKILGVTGTLTTLSEPEVNAVLSYNITRASDMPSFFGRCKLSFNSVDDFQIQEDEEAWTKSILSSVIKIIGNERAVLVFFDEEQRIDKLKSSFENHVARLRIFTGNEDIDEIERSIEEAGVSRTVTLATRRMGRGVDFKSNDSLVENKGGIHVIQTFFSDDIKEEIQIKGRTARKDNVGSYELILCRQHFIKIQYTNPETNTPAQTYLEMCNIRKLRETLRINKIAKNIDKSLEDHKMTMEFMKSFYNYDPKKRKDYLLKYPFVDND